MRASQQSKVKGKAIVVKETSALQKTETRMPMMNSLRLGGLAWGLRALMPSKP